MRMQKFLKIFLATIVTIFTIPFGGITALADGEKVYDDIQDGEYELDINLLKEGTNETSAAAQFVSNQVTLEIREGKAEITFFIPDNPAMEFKKFELEGEKPKTEAGTGEHNDKEVSGKYYTYPLNSVKSNMTPIVSYSVDMPEYNMVFDHENLEMDIELLGLDHLPQKEDSESEEPKPEKPEENGEEESDGNGSDKPEKPEYEPAEEERVVGSLFSESDADEVYELEYETDSRATAGQFENPIKLLVKGDKKYVQIPINQGGAQFFKSLKFNGEEVIWNSIEEGPYTIQYELEDGIKENIDVSMVIDTGQMVMPHDGIKLWFNTDSLTMTKVKDKRVTGKILTEEDVDSVQLYDFDTDSGATAGQLQNPVKLLVKGDKKYVQISINQGGAQYFKSLKFNGEEVIWNSIEEGPYTIQYELKDEIDSIIDVSMIIDTGFMIMPHDGIELWLDNTVSSINLNDKTNINKNDRIVIDDSGNSLKTPNDLPKDVSVTIKSDKGNVNKYGNTQGLELAGEVYEFTFQNLKGEFGNFELVMKYDPSKFPKDDYEVDIYYFNEETKEWEAKKAIVNERTGTLTLEVDSFSTYGVFAKEILEDENDESDEEDPVKDVTKYSIDYIIKHATKDEKSLADDFFVKPGTLIKKGDKTYLQATVKNWSMIDKLI